MKRAKRKAGISDFPNPFSSYSTKTSFKSSWAKVPFFVLSAKPRPPLNSQYAYGMPYSRASVTTSFTHANRDFSPQAGRQPNSPI